MAKKKTGKIDKLREKLDPKLETRTLRLDSVIYERLQEICRDEKWTASKVVNELISDFIELYDEEG